MTKHHLQEVLGAVWAANLQGRLYLHPSCTRKAAAVAYLVRCGALTQVPQSATSLAGYAALQKPGEALASPVRRAIA